MECKNNIAIWGFAVGKESLTEAWEEGRKQKSQSLKNQLTNGIL